MDVQQLVAVYDKPHESPDSGVISSDGEFIPCLFAYLILDVFCLLIHVP